MLVVERDEGSAGKDADEKVCAPLLLLPEICQKRAVRGVAKWELRHAK